MPQKILAGRADDPLLGGDLVRLKVDQVVLSRAPHLAVAEAERLGMKKAMVEVAVAYDTHCVSAAGDAETPGLRSALNYGMLVARPGIGFPAAVHLERFAAPARLAIVDDPRLAAVGGAGMLTIVASPSQIGEVLATGALKLRPPRSVQVLLSGRVRPFVCVRDAALELLRRGLGEVIERIDREHQAPVVLEFAGPSARLLSVPERAVLCGLAPQLGAAGAVFVSDEKTEVYLRDQRRSKAHRALFPDPGAPCDDVITIDLSAVDPLVMDEAGVVRPVRELDGKPVHQIILGGDSGASLRDMLAAAALLKSKKVPPKLDFLIAPPSRQVLEVLAKSGALVDLIATGARLVEPDHRVIAAELYPPPAGGVSLRTFDPEPGMPKSQRFVVASAETLAYAVASGQVGDPRSFKRPVRVTVPRALPTDDVLVVRKTKSKGKAEGQERALDAVADGATRAWTAASTLDLVSELRVPSRPSALVLSTLEDVRWAADRAPSLAPHVRAVIATFIPSGTVPIFAGLGILALTTDLATLKALAKETSVDVPDPSSWNGAGDIAVSSGGNTHGLRWAAVGVERGWTTAGTSQSAAASSA
ncbi:MAG TPA: aconitase family protein [Polyangiaceae bacterium]|jgi:aconitate hydratase|nr:aconitase family protein [Polyangiaceae bacterium]